jgi:hypothetical protein
MHGWSVSSSYKSGSHSRKNEPESRRSFHFSLMLEAYLAQDHLQIETCPIQTASIRIKSEATIFSICFFKL